METQKLYNIDIEQGLIGSLLINCEDFYLVSGLLNKDDFYDRLCSSIYEIMKELDDNSNKFDFKIICQKLSNTLYKTQDVVDLVTKEVCSKQLIVSYAEEIKELSKKRKVLLSMVEIKENIYKDTADNLCNQLATNVMNISVSERDGICDVNSISDEMEEHMKKIERSTGDGLYGIRTGLNDLDYCTGGLEPGELMVVAARPAMGKTSTAISMAYFNLFKNKKVVYISLEMSAMELNKKLLSIQTGIEYYKISNNKKLDDYDRNKVNEYNQWLREKQFYIIDNATSTMPQLKSILKKIEATMKGIDIIYYDYIQLTNVPKMETDLVTKTTFISRQLKVWAKEFKCPVVALSQLSRNVEYTTPQIPRLCHLRDSGSIEQDADMVLMLYRESEDKSVKEKTKPPYEIDLYLEKHRAGQKGMFACMMDPKTIQVKNIDRQQIQPEPKNNLTDIF